MHFYQDDRQGQYNNYSGYDDREQRFPETYTPLPPNSPQPPLSHATPRQNNAPAKADAPPKELKTMSNTAVRCVKVALSFLALGGCAGAILSGVAIANKIDHPDVAGYGICQSLVLLASVYSFGYVALHIKAAGMGRYLYDAGSRSYFMHRIHAWASFSLFLTVVTWTAAIAGLITIVGMNQRSDAQSTLLILDLTACTLGFLPSIVLSCILCGIKRPFYLGNVTVLGEVGEAIKRSKKEGKRVGTENKTNDKRTKDEVWERSDTTSTLSGSTLSGRTCGDNNSLGGSTRSCRTAATADSLSFRPAYLQHAIKDGSTRASDMQYLATPSPVHPNTNYIHARDYAQAASPPRPSLRAQRVYTNDSQISQATTIQVSTPIPPPGNKIRRKPASPIPSTRSGNPDHLPMMADMTANADNTRPVSPMSAADYSRPGPTRPVSPPTPASPAEGSSLSFSMPGTFEISDAAV